MPFEMSRRAYAGMYGPTLGDKVRLADTELFIEVEEDRTIYGEEVKFGGGKVIRDGMGQSQVTRADGAMDTVITNALILDHWGVVKADIGLKDGRIAIRKVKRIDPHQSTVSLNSPLIVQQAVRKPLITGHPAKRKHLTRRHARGARRINGRGPSESSAVKYDRSLRQELDERTFICG